MVGLEVLQAGVEIPWSGTRPSPSLPCAFDVIQSFLRSPTCLMNGAIVRCDWPSA